MQKTTVVLGIGNEFRSDDAVGVHFARQLQALHIPAVTVLEASGEGLELLELWNNADRLFICDAVNSGNAAGMLHILEPQKMAIPTQFFNYSTHAFSLAEAIEMARVLDRLPALVTIYGIEGASFAAGTALSAPVEQTLATVITMVKEILLKDL